MAGLRQDQEILQVSVSAGTMALASAKVLPFQKVRQYANLASLWAIGSERAGL